MTFLFGRSQRDGSIGRDLLSERGRLGRALATIPRSRARRHSVVWAAQRLRADLVSVLPVDAYRKITLAGDKINVTADTPPVLVSPWESAEGHPMDIGEWMYSSQMDLDSVGNFVGVIHKVDAHGLPAQIEPVNYDDVHFTIKGSRITAVRINGEKVELQHLWHERQFTIPGIPVGLSPIAYAALSLQTGLSAQEFAHEWFTNGAAPSAHLRNNTQVLKPNDALATRRRFLASQKAGDVFVSGKDWEYTALSAKAAESGFVEQAKLTDLDQCRYLGVPADMVDVPVESSTMNYANITQRNLQLLVMNLGGAIKRREDALSRTAPGDRFIKLNRAAILAMDEKTRAELLKLQIESRTRTPDEARELDDKPPLSESDYAQFDRLFGIPRSTTPTPTNGGN